MKYVTYPYNLLQRDITPSLQTEPLKMPCCQLFHLQSNLHCSQEEEEGAEGRGEDEEEEEEININMYRDPK